MLALDVNYEVQNFPVVLHQNTIPLPKYTSKNIMGSKDNKMTDEIRMKNIYFCNTKTMFIFSGVSFCFFLVKYESPLIEPPEIYQVKQSVVEKSPVTHRG